MTAKKSGSRLETEIERCRSESQWDRIPELVRQLSAKLISNDRLLRHRRLCQGRSVAKVENQPCCEPRPYPQEPPPAPPTWSPLHPPPGRLAV